MNSKRIALVLLILLAGSFFILPSNALTQTTTTVPEDSDNDGIIDRDDNCPEVPNGLISGTCVKIMSGVFVGTGVMCTDSEECEVGEFCDMVQFDFNNNGIGDACECYANCNCDTKVNLADLVLMKNEFNRIDCPECATTSIITTSVSTTTIEPEYPAPVPQTGQVNCYDEMGIPKDCAGTGEDGDYKMGVLSPNPRFTDHGNDTVTDNLTGLIWTKNAQQIAGTMTWQAALNACNNLVYAGYDDWRLPNLRELQSLVDYGRVNPSLPLGHPFTNVMNLLYWSSTPYAGSPYGEAYFVSFCNGIIDLRLESSHYFYVWPVRGPG